MAEPDPFLKLTAQQMWQEWRADIAKMESRLRRLEVVVALIGVYALGQGGGVLLSRFGI